MTVPSSTSRDQQIGNGVTTGFTVPFRILDQSHLRVLLTVAGVTTEQTLTTHYSVSGVGGASTTVTFVTAPASGAKVTFLRNVPVTQETDYVPNDPFPAESHERALDKITMMFGQLNEIAGEGGRTIKIPAEVSGVSTEMPVPVGATFWGWNEGGTAPKLYTLDDIATTAVFQSWRAQTFAGDGSTTEFTLAADPGNIANLDVSIDGVTQVPTSDYSLLGTQLSFTVAPANGAVILARYGQSVAEQASAATELAETSVSAGDTVVAIPGAAAAGQIVLVIYNGILQHPSAYTVNGASVHFTEALPADGTVAALVTNIPANSVGAGNIAYTADATGAVGRTMRQRLNDLLTILDLGVTADGVTDDTDAATAAARDNEGLYVPAGSYNLTADVYLFGDVSDGVKYTGAGRFYSMRSVLEQSKRFFIQASTDASNTTVPIFLRRQIEVRAVDTTSEPYAFVVEQAPNSTALGLALKFLADYARWSPSKVEELIPYIELGADYLCAMQYRDDAKAIYGGFRGASSDGNTTCFGAACAGRGLLSAYLVTGQPRYLEAARRAVTYLKVLNDPNPTYLALYGETPIPAVAENATWSSFCDRIQSDDKINITSANWNLVAAVFLQEMYDLEGDATLPAIIEGARDFQAYGVLNGLDYFAIKNAAPTSKVSVAWPFFSGHTYADGAWHRLGEPAGTNTVGTDQIEYGLASLYELDYSLTLLRAAYETYRDFAHADVGSTSFGDAYDGAICFTGFFRVNSTVYGGVGGNTVPIDPGSSRAYGGYYDLQGAGTLLKFKYDQYPADFKKSLPFAALAPNRGFATDENFETFWSGSGVGYSYYTKGVIPIAKSCIGILEVLEDAP